MNSGKAVGPDDIQIRVWKCFEEVGIQWLTRLFNSILETRKMPDSWRHNIVVPIYKNKCDIHKCSNYRGIKLMSHLMNLWERVIEQIFKILTALIWRVLGRKKVHQCYIEIIKEMYDRAIISVRSVNGISSEFPVSVGLQQGSALSTYLLS
ncbi:hypothetical protein UlMin_026056 [Ulmus minor]